MGGGPVAVEQAGLGEGERAGAHRRDPPGPGGQRAHLLDERRVAHGAGHAEAADHHQGVDRVVVGVEQRRRRSAAPRCRW